ncbi:sigma-70 family RNA polymerase sigma factor [bacterium]|nr:MAG: sigma-70 family RNA polymerase sigma factor [bacterium]
MSEANLVERVRGGDREASREFVRRYYPSVLRFLTTLCPNPSDAEELTQEAFIKALRGLRKFRGDSGLRTWLHRIAFHEYTHRRRAERSTLPIPESTTTPIFEANSLLALDLERALRCVPEELRAAFVLCDLQELSMQEAATVLSVPVGTVKSRLHTARKRLSDLLEPEPEVQIHVSQTR